MTTKILNLTHPDKTAFQLAAELVEARGANEAGRLFHRNLIGRRIDSPEWRKGMACLAATARLLDKQD
jgi:hypothetical protein